MKFRFDLKHACIALTLLCIEVLIALFVHDRYIRPFIGDVLVVVLIYFAVGAVIKVHPVKLAFAVLMFACTIEFLQYWQLATKLGLHKGSVLYIALGATFDAWDLIAYALGTLLTLLYHRMARHH